MPKNDDSNSSLPQWRKGFSERDAGIELETMNETIDSTSSDMFRQKESLITDRLSPRLDSTPESGDKRIAAQVKNVVFSYGRGKKAVNALNGITINVPEGHM